MQLYCPACKTAAHPAERCARCGERLVAPSELASLSREQLTDPPDLITPTALGRVVVGVVVALGLTVGLREVSLGLLGVFDYSDAAPSAVATWLLRGAAMLIGALLAGAGRGNGATNGGVAALTCVGLLLATDFLAAVKTTQADLVAAARICLLALAAGRVGSALWPAVVPLTPTKTRSRGSSLTPLKDDPESSRQIELSWLRVGLGVAVAVVGVLVADSVRLGMRSLAGHGLSLGSPTQFAVVDFLLASVGILLGGLVAGGGTGAGLRHGTVMGLIAAPALAFLAFLGKDSAVLPLTGLLELAGHAAESPRTATGLAVVVFGLASMCAVSAGFGGILLPRLALKSRRRSYESGPI